MSAPAIVLRAVRRHGPVGLARIAVEEVRLRVWLKEQHVWYQLDLPAPGAAPWDDGDGLCLVHPSAGVDLNPFADLPSMGRTRARARIADGGRPTMVLEGNQAIFACWIWCERMPMLAARGRFMPLPDGVIGLEDSVASPSARGRGIAPRTWRALADEWAARGATAMITKVGVDNAPSRRAVTKAGFREIGLMSYCRRGPVVQVDVAPLGERGLGEELRRRLRR